MIESVFFKNFLKFLLYNTLKPVPCGQWCRNQGGGALAPQYLADQLTLFQPGGADFDNP